MHIDKSSDRRTDVTTQPQFPMAVWVKYGLAFALLWILLTQGDMSSWVIGIVVVASAGWCAIRLFPAGDQQRERSHQSMRPTALFRFVPFFLWQSLKGGWETALLAIHPKKQVHPGFIRYSTRIPAGRPRVVFINTVSLLPGTVSVAWRQDHIIVHALDSTADIAQALQQCEARVAALYGLEVIDDKRKPTSAGDAA